MEEYNLIKFENPKTWAKRNDLNIPIEYNKAVMKWITPFIVVTMIAGLILGNLM